MNNAGIGNKGTSWDGIDNWHKVFDVNVFGWEFILYELYIYKTAIDVFFL